MYPKIITSTFPLNFFQIFRNYLWKFLKITNLCLIFLKLFQSFYKSIYNFRKLFKNSLIISGIFQLFSEISVEFFLSSYILYIKIQPFSVHYFKKLELLNRLRSLIDQFLLLHSQEGLHLIYSHNTSQKYCLSYLPTFCNVNSIFFRYIV